MEVKDNRKKEEVSNTLAKGRVISVYTWDNSTVLVVTLDTGYDIVIEKKELDKIVKEVSKSY